LSSKEPSEIILGARPIGIVDKIPTPEEAFNLTKLDAKALVLKVLGPAVIALGLAIGSGEWLMGPSVAAKYSLLLFWIALISIILQVFYNYTWARLTVATGEPPVALMGRLPGGRFWTWFGTANLLAGHFIPGWASAAATGLLALFLARIPGAAESELVRWTAVGLFLLCALIISVGGKIESSLEVANKIMISFVLIMLIFVVAPLTVTGEAIGEAARGAFSFGYIPPGVDIFLIAGWFGYAGQAAALNYYWIAFYRDKGYGMGSIVGYIPALIGGKKVTLSPLGKLFKITDENLKIFKRWEGILNIEMWGIWFLGALLGMFLPALIVRSLVPVGTALPAWGIAAHMAEVFAAKVGRWGFYLIGLIGFFILFSTQLGVVDGAITRPVVDGFWATSETIRKWAKEDPRRFYYPFLVLYLIFGCASLWISYPLMLVLINANITHFAGLWAIPALIYLDRKVMPKELRAPAWMHIFNIALMICHIFFFVAIVLFYGFGIKIF